MLKDHSSGMSYFVDITWEPMRRHILDLSAFSNKLHLIKQV
jgi:hypothetical protein